MAGLDEERGVYVIVGLGGGAAVAAAKEKVARKAERLKEREKQKEEKRAAKQRKRQLHRERLDALGEGSDMEDYEDESESEDDSESDESSDDDDEAEEKAGRGKGLNRFGNAFQEVIEETGARVKVDSFEHCVVECAQGGSKLVFGDSGTEGCCGVRNGCCFVRGCLDHDSWNQGWTGLQ